MELEEYNLFHLLLVCLLIVLFGVNKLLEFETLRVNTVNERLARAEKESKNIQGIYQEREDKHSQYNMMKKFLDDRKLWCNLIHMLQEKMPDNMWLVTLDYEGEGGGGEGGEGGENGGVVVSSADPNRRQSINSISASTTINRVHIVGYALDHEITTASNFLNTMKEYAKQENSLITDIQPAGNNESSAAWNLYYFEYKLTLREPIKK